MKTLLIPLGIVFMLLGGMKVYADIASLPQDTAITASDSIVDYNTLGQAQGVNWYALVSQMGNNVNWAEILVHQQSGINWTRGYLGT